MNLIGAFRLMLRHWKMILTTALVFSFLTASACWSLLPSVYCAKATLYVLNKRYVYAPSDSSVREPSAYYDLQSAQLMANDFAEVANSKDLRDAAARSVGLRDINEYDIHAEVIPGTRIINLLVTGPNARMAGQIASALSQSVSDTAIRFMGVRAVNHIGGIEVSDHPIAPQRKLLTVSAFFIGLALAGIYVVGEALIDTRVRSERDLADIIPVPVFGHIAVVGRGRVS